MTLPRTRDSIAAFRDRLTAVATGLYIREGEAGLSLRALARAAGVSRTTPYGYFADRDDIIDSIRAAGLDRLTARTAAALAAAPDPLAQMRALGWEVVCFARDEPAIYRLIFSRPVFTPTARPALAAAVERFRKISHPPLATAIRRGLVRTRDATALRRATWAAFHGLVTLHLDGHFASPRQLAADFELLNDIIGHGILTQETTSRARRHRSR